MKLSGWCHVGYTNWVSTKSDFCLAKVAKCIMFFFNQMFFSLASNISQLEVCLAIAKVHFIVYKCFFLIFGCGVQELSIVYPVYCYCLDVLVQNNLVTLLAFCLCFAPFIVVHIPYFCIDNGCTVTLTLLRGR